ncbi:DinB family protein [Lacinutrix iliipiscaria]|uniref:DinB family protein n=1 Tax=Lacinutrix iliipiscaria TaxID=1230532 RepID=A0ABW5WMY4_9FLAO
MKASDLLVKEYIPYYMTYISKVGDLDLIEGLQSSFKTTASFFEVLPDDKFEYAYADKKWTVKEIIQHLIDAERVFAYRALRFARGDKNSLPGYDENAYAPLSLANNRTKEALLDDYSSLRQSTINLFQSFTDHMLMQIGSASGGEMSVRAIGFVIIGHEIHHCEVIKERYL